ncbi:MAG: PilT protein domain-containing protein [Ignavibacteria bacterium]|nr:MAG: PilT protein domain-containing protein [Ignavibacteria bacterium]
MLIDTDVLMWYLRGNEKAKRIIEEQDGFSISVITYIELVQGMRNKNELLLFRKSAPLKTIFFKNGTLINADKTDFRG